MITCIHSTSLGCLEWLLWLTGNLRHLTAFSRVSIFRSEAEPVFCAFKEISFSYWQLSLLRSSEDPGEQTHRPTEWSAQSMCAGHFPSGGHWAQNWCLISCSSCNSILKLLLSVSRFKSWHPDVLKGLTCWEMALRSLAQDLLFWRLFPSRLRDCGEHPVCKGGSEKAILKMNIELQFCIYLPQTY